MDIVTDPLRMFREGVQSYQPQDNGIPLEPETGDAGPSLRNVRRLVSVGLQVQDILVRPTGALIQFITGEQYLATGLRVGEEAKTVALAEIATDAGFGSYEKLLRMYLAIPCDYDGILPKPRE
jgi:hypothetical protein